MKKLLLLVPVLAFVLIVSGQTRDSKHWRFVSMPDFLNVDTDYPQKVWEVKN